jgi:hypothetical protein
MEVPIGPKVAVSGDFLQIFAAAFVRILRCFCRKMFPLVFPAASDSNQNDPDHLRALTLIVECDTLTPRALGEHRGC